MNPTTIVVGCTGGVGSALVELSGAVGVSSRHEFDIEKALQEATPGSPVHMIDAAGMSKDATMRSSSPPCLETVTVNLARPLRLSAMFSRAVADRPNSSLLFLGSVVARLGVRGAVAYGASKAGLSGLVRGLAAELAPFKSRANVIEMGYFDAGMMLRLDKSVQARIVASIPLGRTGTMAELWAACSAVLSNGYITGATIPVTGGL